MCWTSINAGYFIGLEKSQLIPGTVVRFLGFHVDSVAQAFLIPPDKQQTFLALLSGILDKPWVSQKTLQRLAGNV